MTDAEKIAAYDALLAEAVKIQPSAHEVAIDTIDHDMLGTPSVARVRVAIERERLLGVLREQALRSALREARSYFAPDDARAVAINAALSADHPASVLSKVIEERLIGLLRCGCGAPMRAVCTGSCENDE